jgi:hypothetical protein
MTRWLGKWTSTDQLHSLPRPETVKASIMMLQMAKADMDSGLVKDWWTQPGWHEGFIKFEGSETEVSAAVLKYSPYLRFEVTPMISLAQAFEIADKIAAAAKTKMQ